jgi:BON domain-containing protein
VELVSDAEVRKNRSMADRLSSAGFRRAALALVLAALVQSPPAADGAPRTNVFHDPFLAVTNGLPACPVPEGPLFTEAEARAEAHGRSQRGVSCYLSGRCRLSNAYLYDQEIVPRVDKAIHADGRFADTSVWVLGQRRWVFLKGCVKSGAESAALERLVKDIDDVEVVINELSVGTAAKPRYTAER